MPRPRVKDSGDHARIPKTLERCNRRRSTRTLVGPLVGATLVREYAVSTMLVNVGFGASDRSRQTLTPDEEFFEIAGIRELTSVCGRNLLEMLYLHHHREHVPDVEAR